MYQTIFDNTEITFPWTQIIAPLAILVFIGVLTLAAHKQLIRPRFPYGKQHLVAFGYILMLLTTIYTVAASAITINNYLECRTPITSAKVTITEGVIREFQPGGTMSINGTERFSINGKAFSYSPFQPTLYCFTQTAGFGGPIHQGSEVRIYYIDNKILRVDERQ